MPDRAVSNISISIAPFYKRRISSVYALSDFDSTIMLSGCRHIHLSASQQFFQRLSVYTIQKRTATTVADHILH